MIHEVPNCSCGSVAKINKFLEEQRLMFIPLPSIATVHSLLIHEKRQRDITTSPTIVSEARAMNVNNSHNSHKKQLQCTHCRKTGHVKSQCYRLNGFPADLNSLRQRKLSQQFIM